MENEAPNQQNLVTNFRGNKIWNKKGKDFKQQCATDLTTSRGEMGMFRVRETLA